MVIAVDVDLVVGVDVAVLAIGEDVEVAADLGIGVDAEGEVDLAIVVDVEVLVTAVVVAALVTAVVVVVASGNLSMEAIMVDVGDSEGVAAVDSEIVSATNLRRIKRSRSIKSPALV